MFPAIAVFKREIASYFATPLAYVFLVIFLVLASSLTFFMGNFFERGQADLQAFFGFLPWLYLFLVPALSMRLWADERKSGTIELLLTLPLYVGQAVVGKFLASWAFCAVGLLLAFPLVIAVSILGTPDYGVIAASAIGALLMSGAFLAIGSAMSALTRNQVIAFVLTATVCFLITASGTTLVTGAFAAWAPTALVEFVSGFSVLTHFANLQRGILDARDILYFTSLILGFLMITTLIVDLKKAE